MTFQDFSLNLINSDSDLSGFQNLTGLTGLTNLFAIGNVDLIKLPKTAFLCSRQVPASAVLKCYDWAIEQREQGVCVISGFHSQIEKDVLHYLLKGKQPIIVVLARGLKEKLEPEFEQPLEQGRLLIISPFDKTEKRITQRTSEIRNKLMINLADQISVGFISPQGQLAVILQHTDKPIQPINLSDFQNQSI